MPLPVTPGFPAVAPAYAPRVGLSGTGAYDVSGLAYTGVQPLCVITVGGTTGTGPVVTISVGGNSQAYTYVAGDTTTTIAAGHIVTALNGNGAIAALVTASSSTNVITLTPVATLAGQSAMIAVTSSVTGGAATMQIGGLGVAQYAVTGTTGSGPTATVNVNGTAVAYSYVAGDTTTTIAAGHIAGAINANGTVNQLVVATNLNSAGVAGNIVFLSSINHQPFNTSETSTGGAVLTLQGVETDFDAIPYIVYPLSTFSYSAPGSDGAITFYQGMPREVDQYTFIDLKTQGQVQ